MQSSEVVLNELSKQAQNKEYQFQRLYRIMYNPDMYIKAYSNIYSNKGISTSGTDNETADNFSENRINAIIEEMKTEAYQAQPVRRIYIPKKNGKTRPLGIPNFKDRLVQEVCRMILDAIYEPVFSKRSHGFRPDKSCQTALVEIQNTFKGVNWFIEGDIKGCFDNIDHHVLVNILRKRIKDERFIRLIWKFLKAGYMENWKYNKTYSGTPQGGIVSPILANIYLDKLDTYIEGILTKWFTRENKGTPKQCRIRNPIYIKLSNNMSATSKRIDKAGDEMERTLLIKHHKKLRALRNREPEKLGFQNYRNMRYVRYADDFIIGVMGSKNDCEIIKRELTNFVRLTLKLELSTEKTLITYSRDGARFLNYEIGIRDNDRFFEFENGVKRRAGNLGICLKMPKEVMMNYINNKKLVKDINSKEWRAKARPYLLNLSDLEIVTTYNAEMRGLYNYYSLAENVSDRMNMIYYVMEYSCLKTLAGKHKSSVAKIRAKLSLGKGWGVRYDTKNEKNKIRFFYRDGFKMKKTPYQNSDVDKIANTMIYRGHTELESRIKAKKCELCGIEDVQFEIHHVNKVKNLKGKEEWERIMISKNRKTLVLCKECHKDVHR